MKSLSCSARRRCSVRRRSGGRGSPDHVPFEFVFDDVNPCTGAVHTVTIAGTTFAHFTMGESSRTARGRSRRVQPG